jgi:hypothetical protein
MQDTNSLTEQSISIQLHFEGLEDRNMTFMEDSEA